MTDALLDELEARSKREDFRGFRCWSTAEVGDVMHREAAAPSRAVLLATHQPPRIRRVTVTEAGRFGADEAVTQDDVLQAVVSETDRSLIVPVIGASGSGKSHLVLWMRARLEENGSANRKIIYLPKGETSLSGVIDRLLDGRTGGAFDQIRDAVAHATRNMTAAEAARRLRDELSVAAGGIDPHDGGAARQPFRQHVRDNIAKLLDDPVYSERLTGEGGALRRIVDQARAGGSEEPAEFKPEDLDINLTAVELEPLSQPAKMLLSDLKTPQLHDEALAVLNEIRDLCLSRVFGVEPMQLVGVMRKLRELLYKEEPDLELILMIEDFTLLQGIQHDLLEAMIELPTREGRQVLCAMTTVMAVTDGFFSRMLASSDTLRTRIAAQGHVYSLDVQYGEAGIGAVDEDTLLSFAGRYLNAVRVGAAGLDHAGGSVPNACLRCRHQDVCHGSFGTGADGEFGLYPFNAAALDRMVRSRQQTFNPRDLLSVIAQTLTAHVQDLAEGRFPSRAWERRFDPRRHNRPALPTLSLRTQEEVDALPKSEQRTVLLTFWGGVPEKVGNLPEGIHRAFDIPPSAGGKAVERRVRPEPERVRPPEPKADDLETAVIAWRDGAELAADVARILRRAFRDAIVASTDIEDELVSGQLLQEFFGQDTDIRIDRSRGSGRPGADRFAVSLDVSNENALLFVAVLRAQRQQSWDVEDGHSRLVQFLAIVSAEAARLRSFLVDRLAERRADQDAAVALLALVGLAAGQGTTGDARGLLSAAFSTGATSSVNTPERWQALMTQLESRREATRAFALQGAQVARGAGEAAGVDGSRFLGVLGALRSEWQLPTLSEEAPQATQRLRQILEQRLDAALGEVQEVLSDWHRAVEGLVGDADTVDQRVKTWRMAVKEAGEAGFLVTARGFSGESSLVNLSATVRAVGSLLAEWETYDLGRRVGVVARLPWARLDPLREQLEALAETLRASREKARAQEGGEVAGSPMTQFDQAIDRLTEAVT